MNGVDERMYEGLGCVTFVNGRTTRRGLGMEEMESVLGAEKAQGPELKECSSLGKGRSGGGGGWRGVVGWRERLERSS